MFFCIYRKYKKKTSSKKNIEEDAPQIIFKTVIVENTEDTP